MFQGAELGRNISKAAFREEVPDLRTRLLELQWRLRESPHPVIIIMEGVDGSGRGELVNRLYEWLDPRGLQTSVFWQPSDEERERPYYWRFWRALPGRGQIGILFGGWYGDLITEAVNERREVAEVDDELARIARLEEMLVRDGAIIVKFWLHLSADKQKKRLKQRSGIPAERRRFGKRHKTALKLRDKLINVGERVIRRTDSGLTPWYLVEADDERYRDVTVGRTLLRAMETAMAAAPLQQAAEAVSHSPSLPQEARITLLDHVDLGQTLAKPDYRKALKHYQRKLRGLMWKAHAQQRSLVLVFEGWDAAGKGGAIRRLVAGMDARLYRIVPVAAPTDEELARHYLWRFWRRLPRAGRATLFDRSWYGRVLVERVEGIAQPAQWRQAYTEINDFEEQLVEHGVMLAKFWLHISPEEQLQRFQAREATPYKQYKITDEDWRNREHWNDYRAAVNEMVMRTGTEYAPWHLIAANDKRFARIDVLRRVCELLESALD